MDGWTERQPRETWGKPTWYKEIGNFYCVVGAQDFHWTVVGLKDSFTRSGVENCLKCAMIAAEKVVNLEMKGN